MNSFFSKVGLTAMLTDMNIYNTETATKNHNLSGQTKSIPRAYGHPLLSSGLHHGNISVQKLYPIFQPNIYNSKMGKYGVGIKMIKSDFFQYFSIKSYVVDVY